MFLILILFLMSPFIVLIYHFPSFQVSDFSELNYVFSFTFKQAFVSSLISVVFGAVGAFGLLHISGKKYYKYIEFFSLAPSFIPIIFVVFGCLNLSIITSLNIKGFWGIVFVHVVINIGLCSVLLSNTIRNKLTLVNKLNAVQSGKSGFSYFRKLIIPIIFKDVVFIFSSIFLFCFTSFSIPLVIGGVSSTTVDLLIYEKLLAGQINESVSIAILQFIFLAIFMCVLNKVNLLKVNYSGNWYSSYRLGWLSAVPVLPGILITFGVFAGEAYKSIFSFHQNILSIIIYSLLIALLAAYIMFLFIQLVLYCYPNSKLHNFLIHYSSPSTVLICLAMILCFTTPNILKSSLGFIYVLVFLPFLFKMFVQNFVSKILPAIKLAKVMGGSSWVNYKKIVLPLSFNLTLFLSFLTAAWALGDYAISSVILQSDDTLALKIKTYMRSYRLEEAYNLLFCLLICEIVLFILYKGISSFGYKKYQL